MGINAVINETKPKMASVVEDLQKKLAAVRTGRANTGLLDKCRCGLLRNTDAA